MEISSFGGLENELCVGDRNLVLRHVTAAAAVVVVEVLVLVSLLQGRHLLVALVPLGVVVRLVAVLLEHLHHRADLAHAVIDAAHHHVVQHDGLGGSRDFVPFVQVLGGVLVQVCLGPENSVRGDDFGDE